MKNPSKYIVDESRLSDPVYFERIDGWHGGYLESKLVKIVGSRYVHVGLSRLRESYCRKPYPNSMVKDTLSDSAWVFVATISGGELLAENLSAVYDSSDRIDTLGGIPVLYNASTIVRQARLTQGDTVFGVANDLSMTIGFVDSQGKVPLPHHGGSEQVVFDASGVEEGKEVARKKSRKDSAIAKLTSCDSTPGIVESNSTAVGKGPHFEETHCEGNLPNSSIKVSENFCLSSSFRDPRQVRAESRGSKKPQRP